jgi:hypothetical protein
MGMVGQEGPVSAQSPSSFLRPGRGMRCSPVVGVGPRKMPVRLSNADCGHLFRGILFMYCLLYLECQADHRLSRGIEKGA